MDKFRDKTRDNLYDNLINLEIDCKLANRKIVEEKLFNSWYQRSLGIIEINENTPIKYINILKKDGSKDSPPRWWHYFAIPSEKIISKKYYLDIQTNRKKNFPIFGRVKEIIWKPNEIGQHIVERFKHNDDFNNLAFELGDIRVQSLHDKFSGYAIEIEPKGNKIGSRGSLNLNKNHWNTINQMANLCLDLDLSTLS